MQGLVFWHILWGSSEAADKSWTFSDKNILNINFQLTGNKRSWTKEIQQDNEDKKNKEKYIGGVSRENKDWEKTYQEEDNKAQVNSVRY